MVISTLRFAELVVTGFWCRSRAWASLAPRYTALRSAGADAAVRLAQQAQRNKEAPHCHAVPAVPRGKLCSYVFQQRKWN